MRKTFQLTDPKKKPERQVDYVKHEVKKYLGRERRKKVPEGADFWEFDCRIGPTEDDPVEIRVTEIGSRIDKLVAENHASFYLEILAKPGHKPKKEQ